MSTFAKFAVQADQTVKGWHFCCVEEVDTSAEMDHVNFPDYDLPMPPCCDQKLKVYFCEFYLSDLNFSDPKKKMYSLFLPFFSFTFACCLFISCSVFSHAQPVVPRHRMKGGLTRQIGRQNPELAKEFQEVADEAHVFFGADFCAWKGA